MKLATTLLQESLDLRSRYDEEPSHSDHVARLALQAFDGLRSWHRLDDRQRELLHSAALLHDIGWSQTPDGRGHHKESARLIRDYAWKNLTPDEAAIVAQIARYHRKAPPQPDHAEFQALKAAAQKRVMILGGILRIADALDRTHSARIEQLDISVTAGAIVVRVKPVGSWYPEKDTFEIKRDMLQAAAARPVNCEAMTP
jgi:exopolyphosphatase/guanosine-5'-triphosphate,3'-diphosphate pyrophosphatase